MKNILITLALLISAVSFGQTGEEYFDSGLSKYDLKDFYGAISDYNKAIELDPNYVSVYYNRAISKYYINDLNGACEDARKSGSLVIPFPQMIEAACN